MAEQLLCFALIRLQGPLVKRYLMEEYVAGSSPAAATKNEEYMSAAFITEAYLRALGARDFYVLYKETKQNLNAPPARRGDFSERAKRMARIVLMEQIAIDRGIDLEGTVPLQG